MKRDWEVIRGLLIKIEQAQEGMDILLSFQL